VEQGQGPLVLLIHGFPEFWYSWRYQIPVLAEAGYHVVAPDLRGYNLTDKPDWGYDVGTLSADVVALIRSFGYEKAVVVGHDWGGAIAWHAATFYPEQIQRLVILNCPHPNLFYKGMRQPAQLNRSWYMFFFQLPWIPEWALSRKDYQFVKRALRGSAVQKNAFDHETLQRYRDAIAKPQALSKAIRYYRVMFRDFVARRSFPWEQPVKMPTLLVWGEQDVALGKELNEGLSEWVKDLTVHYIHDSGHWVQQEKHEEVNRHILGFLGSPLPTTHKEGQMSGRNKNKTRPGSKRAPKKKSSI
jgi:pimeloyl-ACP methyl ester carboxylesterase